MSRLKLEKIYDLIEEGSNKLFVVEGKNDSEPLRKLGFTKIIEISGKPTHKLIDEIVSTNTSSVVVLTDFDEDGLEKYSEISHLLNKYHIKVDSSFRHRIKTSFKIHKIEEITSFTKFKEDDYSGKISPVNDKILNRSRILSRWSSGKAGRNRSGFRSD